MVCEYLHFLLENRKFDFYEKPGCSFQCTLWFVSILIFHQLLHFMVYEYLDLLTKDQSVPENLGNCTWFPMDISLLQF